MNQMIANGHELGEPTILESSVCQVVSGSSPRASDAASTCLCTEANWCSKDVSKPLRPSFEPRQITIARLGTCSHLRLHRFYFKRSRLEKENLEERQQQWHQNVGDEAG